MSAPMSLKEAAAELGIRPALVPVFATATDLEMYAKEDGNDGVLLYFGRNRVAALKESIRMVCGSRSFENSDYHAVVVEMNRQPKT